MNRNQHLQFFFFLIYNGLAMVDDCDYYDDDENYYEEENRFIRILDNLLINLFSSKNNLRARWENCRSYNSLKLASLNATIIIIIIFANYRKQ